MPNIIELDEGWVTVTQRIEQLKQVLDSSSSQVTPMSAEQWMDVYSAVYNMCTQKPPHDYSPQIYERYGEEFKKYIDLTVLPSLAEKHGEYKLQELVRRWTNYKVFVRWLARLFHYLDRYYIARNSKPTLREVGYTCFRDMVYGKVKAEIRASVIGLIEKEREGDRIDRTLVKNLIVVFVENVMTRERDTSSYEEDFEKDMLLETAEYYSRKAAIWVVEDTCSEYMLKTEECMKKEKERVSHYLHSSTEPKLLEKLQHELLVVYDTQILDKEESGCRVLLQNDKADDLSRIYRLYLNIPNGLEPVVTVFREHVTNEGKALLQQAEEAAAASSSNQQGPSSSGSEQFGLVLVQKLIELHDKYLGYVTGCFSGNSLFHKALKQAFEVVCDKYVAGVSSAEMLAMFCDDRLKKGGTKLSDDEVDKCLEKVVKLLVYISDKDLFAEFCKKKLARRLLFDKCENIDYERNLLTKLKQEFGAQFTSKMEGMVTDLAVGEESQAKFREFTKIDNRNPGLNLSVQVLTTGYWPSYKSSDLNLPEEMIRCVEIFKDFFNSQHNRRKLSWIHSLGSCLIEGKFDSKTIELNVTTYQASLLLLFNNAESLSFSEISTQLNLTRDELVRLLHSLACAKYKILLKEPSTKTISQSDTFKLNTKFTDRLRRIRIPMPPMDERKKVTEDVDKDRKFAIDAAIVRIMKSRKVLGHQQLVMECVDILKGLFKPDIKAIKKRIEDLITREYLERDKENPNTFRYLA